MRDPVFFQIRVRHFQSLCRLSPLGAGAQFTLELQEADFRSVLIADAIREECGVVDHDRELARVDADFPYTQGVLTSRLVSLESQIFHVGRHSILLTGSPAPSGAR